MIVKLLTEHHLEFLSLKRDCRGSLSLHMSKCHIIESHMHWLYSQTTWFITGLTVENVDEMQHFHFLPGLKIFLFSLVIDCIMIMKLVTVCISEKHTSL